ncbi:metallophosphoesterase [Pseudobacillus wudalianchiensis]|uniref:Metallophosphoesterase n=1 Tax=Pseudobacillus wudalianchiensis TaxID=1743143 RepID=A0A1B9AT91_9BACI|nr:metallophosphoesterase [Bacillus wudalianchiensis]OCA87054.1 metallophosphoesterase [Bacillus wudalianchiensis]
MKEKLSRRSFLKQSLTFLLSLLGLAGGGYSYARFIEPKRLQINEVAVTHELIPRAFHNKRIVQFSDTHLGFQYTVKQLNEHVEKIHSLRPDFIFFTGDLLDRPDTYSPAETKTVTSILQKLQAPLGKFAVYGNHDHGGYGTDLYKFIMQESGFQLLKNKSVELRHLNESIYLLGIDDASLGQPSFSQTKKKVKEGHYLILLSHAPDLAKEAANAGIHLQLSGHSHGGQIQLPWYGALYTPPYAEIYKEGQYIVDGETRLALYVNRGLGTTRLPFRFLSIPEITVFTLKSPS